MTPDHCQINGSLRPGVPPAPGAGGRSCKVHAPFREKPGPVAAEPPTKARAPEGDGDRRSRGPCALVDCTRAAWGAWWKLSLSLSGLCPPHSCTDTCTHMHAQAQTHADAHVRRHTLIQTRAHGRVQAHTCTRMHACADIRTLHMNPRAHTYTHACTHS